MIKKFVSFFLVAILSFSCFGLSSKLNLPKNVGKNPFAGKVFENGDLKIIFGENTYALYTNDAYDYSLNAADWILDSVSKYSYNDKTQKMYAVLDGLYYPDGRPVAELKEYYTSYYKLKGSTLAFNVAYLAKKFESMEIYDYSFSEQDDGKIKLSMKEVFGGNPAQSDLWFFWEKGDDNDSENYSVIDFNNTQFKFRMAGADEYIFVPEFTKNSVSGELHRYVKDKDMYSITKLGAIKGTLSKEGEGNDTVYKIKFTKTPEVLTSVIDFNFEYEFKLFTEGVELVQKKSSVLSDVFEMNEISRK